MTDSGHSSLVAARNRVEGREGMVTVYDSDGRYVGCMGVALWKALLDAGSAARPCECDAPRCEREGCQDTPTHRVRMDLADGAHMDVNVSPDVSPETLAALRSVGEAAARRLRDEPCRRCKGKRVIPTQGPEWFVPCPECDGAT